MCYTVASVIYKTLQIYPCSLKKITSVKGLKIHQGKKRCQKERQDLALITISKEVTQVSRVKSSDWSQTKVRRASAPSICGSQTQKVQNRVESSSVQEELQGRRGYGRISQKWTGLNLQRKPSGKPSMQIWAISCKAWKAQWKKAWHDGGYNLQLWSREVQANWEEIESTNGREESATVKEAAANATPGSTEETVK